MANYEGPRESGNAGDIWLKALNENVAPEEDVYARAPEQDEPVQESDINAASLAALHEAMGEGGDDGMDGGDGGVEDAPSFGGTAETDGDINAAGLNALYEANGSGIQAREQDNRNKESLDALFEANYLESLEAAERDMNEGFWKNAGNAVTKIYRKLVGLATGRKVETSAESAEATREVAGKVGKKVLEVAEKLVKAGASAAAQTVMQNMGYGG